MRPYLLLVALLGFSLLSCKNDSSQTPEGFQVESGFRLERVASEPLIKDPVDLVFDETGAAYVLEMPGYPFEDKSSRVIRLWDTNSDAVYDSSSVFAENLQLASSIMPYRKGLLVAAPPYLLFVRDNDLDHRAESVDTLMGGFSTGNLQHNYNGLSWGLDNYIYAVNGGNSGSPYWWPDSTKRINIRGNDFRFTLTESKGRVRPGQMELIGASSHGFELAMDPAGRLFETHNMEHMYHLVFPDRYKQGTRLIQDQGLDNISDHEEMGTARIYPIGEQESRVNHPEQSGYFSGGCGVCFYDGGAFGPEYNNTIWVADVVLNLLHVDRIQPDGASLKASRILEGRDVLASNDRAFRPVNMTVGPDGALYVLDFHRKVIEHPEWIPDDIENTLDLNAGKDQGRIYRLTRSDTKSEPFDLNQLKEGSGIMQALEHSNQWVVRTAHRLLSEQAYLSDNQINDLNNLIERSSSNPEAWRGMLRALSVMQHHKALRQEHVLKALASSVPEVRERALVLAEEFINQDSAVLEAVLSKWEDPDQRVRMQAGLTASTLSDANFEKGMTGLTNKLEHAVALSTDSWNIAAYTLAFRRDPATAFRNMAGLKPSAGRDDMLISLALVAASDVMQARSVFHELAQAGTGPMLQKRVAEQLLKNTPTGSGFRAWEADFQALEKQEDPDVISMLAALRKKFGLSPSSQFISLSKEATGILADRSKPDSIRSQQLAVVALLPFSSTASALYACLANTEPLKLQEGAMKILAEQDDKGVGRILVEKWSELGPQARKWASDLLLYKHIHHDALLSGLEKKVINIGEMNFDLERRRELLWWTDDMKTRRRAEALFSDSGVRTRADALEKASASLTLTGDHVKGAAVFNNVCSNCHRFGKIGNEVGPVLTEISRKSKESILHEIVDPNSAVDPRYINHRIDTKDGKVYTGIVEKETDEYITLRRMGGEELTIYKRDMTRFASLGTSLMMEGLETAMTQQEMADLLAYLTKP